MPTTKSGRFKVHRPTRTSSIHLTHVPSGLPCGSFSHLSIRTFKAAIAGVEEAEARLSRIEWGLIDRLRKDSEGSDFDTRQALNAWQAELQRAFPAGAWSR